MTAVSWLLALAILQASSAGSNKFGSMVLAVTDFTKSVVKGGHELFKQLAELQTDSVLDDLYNDSRELYDKKWELRQRMSDRSLSESELYNRLAGMNPILLSLENELEKFGEQISSLSDLKSGPLQSAVPGLAGSKEENLLKVGDSWRDKDFKQAGEYLNKAISESKQLQSAISCLRDTVKQQKAACDATTLQPIATPAAGSAH